MDIVLHNILAGIVNYAIILFEFIGVMVLIHAGIKGLFGYIFRNPLTRLNLAKGMAMGLEFKLGSEILRTVIVRDFEEIALVGAIIILRAALTLLIHWEIKNEEAHVDLKLELDRIDAKTDIESEINANLDLDNNNKSK